MRNVIARFYSLITFLSVIVTLSLSGCTKAANLAVQALSTTLVAMKTTNVNPFNQDFKANKYALFSGTCLDIITSLQISFNDGSWQNISMTTPSPVNGTYPINGTLYPYTETLTPSGPYDVNCSDSTFYFWIYEHHLDEMIFNSFRVLPTVDLNITKIAIRGVSGSYTTEPTVYMSPHIPAKLTLEKDNPSLGTAPGHCSELIINLRSGSDLFARHSAAIPFSLAHKINSTIEPPYDLYSSYEGCLNLNPLTKLSPTSLEIPANQSSLRVFHKMPAIADAPVGQIHEFKINYGNSPIALDISLGVVSFVVKDPSSIYFDVDAPYKILLGMCYPVDITIREYSGALFTTNDTINISSTAGLKIFSTNACSTEITSFTTLNSTHKLYIKLFPTSDIRGSISVSSLSVDKGIAQFDYDISNEGTVNYVQVNGHKTINFSDPNPAMYWVAQFNKNGTPIVTTAVTTIPLILDAPKKGIFCTGNSSSTCSGTVTSASIPAGEYYTTFHYQAHLGDMVTISPNLGVTGVANVGETVTINGGITKLDFVSPPTSITSGVCQPMTVQTSQSTGAAAVTKSNLLLTITSSVTGELYSDVSCITPLSASPQILATFSNMTFYWKPLVVNGTTRSILINADVISSASKIVNINL